MFRQLIDSVKKMFDPPKGRIVIHDSDGLPCVLLTRAALELLIAESYEAGANDQAIGYATKESRDALIAIVSPAIKAMDEQAYGT